MRPAPPELQPGVLDDAAAAEAYRIARAVVRRHPVPSRWRDDVIAEAAVAVMAAWGSGQLIGPAGMWQVAWRAAERWSKALVCGLLGPSTAGHTQWADLPTVLPRDAHLVQDMQAEAPPAEAGQRSDLVRALLGRLVDELVDLGMDPSLAAEGVAVATDVLGDAGQQRRTVRSVPAAEVIAEQAGIGLWSARALVVLLMGPTRRSGRPPVAGLLERALDGDDVWADPRVARQLREVVWPTRSRPRGAWAPTSVVGSPDLAERRSA